MPIKDFVSMLRNYHDAGKNASATYEGEQRRVAELSNLRNKDINYMNHRIWKDK